MFKVEEIDKRIKRKISLVELGVVVAAFLLNIYLFIFISKGTVVDYHNYLYAVQGDYQQFFYGYWLLPLLYPFSRLPFIGGYLIWTLLNIAGVWFAARVFNGKSVIALISYQFLSVLYFGQITGILCGMIALFWWGMHKQKYIFGGLALLIAISKPQTGAMVAILLWLFAEIPWQKKIRVWIIPMLGILITFLVYPTWLYDIYSRLGNVITWSNVSLRQWIGSWALILLIPVILLPMNRQLRFLMVTAALIMNSPYFLQQDLLILLIFPIGWFPVILGYIPAIMFTYYSFEGHPSGVVIPIYLYIKVFIESISRWAQNRKSLQINN